MNSFYRIFSSIVLLSIAATAMAQQKIPAGEIIEDYMYFEYAVYFTEDTQRDKNEVLEMIKKNYAGLQVLDSIPEIEEVSGSQVIIHEVSDVANVFPAPDLEFLQYTGNGLSENQMHKLQSSHFVIVLDFVCEKDNFVATMTMANELVASLPVTDNDIIWDAETRESFTRTYWNDHRLVKNNSINISRHITIHFYPKGDYCRAITLGMLKFGLPDIAIENLSCRSDGSLASLINLTAQTLLEKQSIDEEGKLMLDIDAVENEELRKFFLASIEEGAEKKAEVDLIQAIWEEGDPENIIFEMTFSGDNPQIEHNNLIGKLFGVFDEVTYRAHDDEVLAASERAKERLPELKEMFLKGLPINTHLLMKFPFENADGDREWMWVEVVKWEDETITGLLQNEPQIVTHVRSGQVVTKNLEDMFDYILYFPDETYEGNETGKIMSGQK